MGDIVRVSAVGSLCFVNTNNVNVDTLIHCFLSLNGRITNCSHARDKLAGHLGTRKTTVRCRSGYTLVPSDYESGRRALIICAPTMPRRRNRLY